MRITSVVMLILYIPVWLLLLSLIGREAEAIKEEEVDT